ncbi:Uncharacterised protein [Vibrio cholerae]|nr:Uncharacterised protein [Vibrio cholerae]
MRCSPKMKQIVYSKIASCAMLIHKLSVKCVMLIRRSIRYRGKLWRWRKRKMKNGW